MPQVASRIFGGNPVSVIQISRVGEVEKGERGQFRGHQENRLIRRAQDKGEMRPQEMLFS